MTTRLESPPAAEAHGRRPWFTRGFTKESLAADVAASFVVFLVALPLCIGIAVASGVPAELGIITGVVGGLVVGFLPGSTMQVSGPAAGLTVLVSSTVAEQGLAMLGVIVLGAGLLQMLLAMSRLGTWFRAISPSVVQGMLAGIGVVLLLGQIYPAGGFEQPMSTAGKIAGIPALATAMVSTPVGLSGLSITVFTLVVMGLWNRLPQRIRMVPAALVAVVAAGLVASVSGLPLSTIEIGALFEAIDVPSFGAFEGLADTAVLGAILTFALIASCESLFSAAGIDRMHDGAKTRYNKELMAQGAGNTVCGLLGALPLTAVIVRSSTNLRAGARTKLSRVLHGVWMLLFVVLLPGVLSYLPSAALAALLLHAGWKLIAVRHVAELVRTHRSEAFVLVLTAVLIVLTDLLVGTLTGIAVAIVKSAWEMSRLSIHSSHSEDHIQIEIGGNATFLRLPHLLDHLEQLPLTSRAHVDLSSVRHLDRACEQAVENWVAQRRRSACAVEVAMPAHPSWRLRQ
ncbi:SulP family inorganic anion transporter [Haloactinomyces albus]|uniref:MFS superfamily sulfate permease-like transporter n=1 Tax=Haloactinomyces albus TaxID=1352928 RepID=A0AAE3ZE78_9ACTN|nr:SulP family inorganic anion transporter [Haloactinomyces albus]MDR7303287.1 MFS superfamily sulfate permease-like transporter [Haloactinomyces albus]